MDEAMHTITQKRFLRGSQQFAIEGHTLRLERRRGFSWEQRCFDLHDFQPEPLRIRHVPLGRILLLLVAIASAGMLLTWGMRTAHDNTSATAVFFGLLLAFAIPVIALLTCVGFVNVTAFQGAFIQIRLWHNLPDKATFDEFLGVLRERIRASRGHGHTILRDLRLANIIDDQQYHQAKELLKGRASGDLNSQEDG